MLIRLRENPDPGRDRFKTRACPERLGCKITLDTTYREVIRRVIAVQTPAVKVDAFAPVLLGLLE